MKLQKIHIFLILLLSLIFASCLGTFLREGMSSQRTVTGTNGNTVTATTGPEGNTAITGPGGNTAVVDGYDASSTTYTGSGGNSATVTSGPYGNTVVTTNTDGIQYNDIPDGQEDLYILKSEIVPPVCPACPQSTACPRQEKCPPCPACARCPEPAFECKKVPNYSSTNDNFLPRPVLSDFSQFGM